MTATAAGKSAAARAMSAGWIARSAAMATTAHHRGHRDDDLMR